jgi:hypothetical protein
VKRIADTAPICDVDASAANITNKSHQKFEKWRMLIEEIHTLPIAGKETPIKDFIENYRGWVAKFE